MKRIKRIRCQFNLSYLKFQMQISAILIIMISLAFISPADARVGMGGKPGALLTFGAGARSFGMGKAYVSVADDASATIWNPAGLALVDRKEVTALHSILYFDTNLDFLSYAHPTLDMGTFGLSILFLSSVGFEGRDVDNVVTGVFSASQLAAGGSYGVRLLEKVYAGANIKYFSNTLSNSSNGNVLLDLGILSRPLDTPNLSIGMSLNNLLNFKIGDPTDDIVPIVVRLGASYLFLNDQLIVSADYESSMQGWFLGTEYKIFDPKEGRPFQVAVRLGINFEEITGGFGAWYQDYGLDYSFSTQELGGSHRFSATVRFGESIAYARAKRDEAIRLGKKAESKREYEAGVAKYEKGLYVEALENFKKAVECDADNFNAKDMKKKMELVTEFVPKQIDESEVAELIRKGIKYYIENDTTTSFSALKVAIYKDPEDKRVYNLARAIEKDTGVKFNYEVWENLDEVKKKIAEAKGKYYTGEFSQMVKLCREVVQVKPDSAEAWGLLGSAYYALGDKNEALRAWKRAIQLKPDDKVLSKFIQELEKQMNR